MDNLKQKKFKRFNFKTEILVCTVLLVVIILLMLINTQEDSQQRVTEKINDKSVKVEIPVKYSEPLIISNFGQIFSIQPVKASPSEKIQMSETGVRYIEAYQATDVEQIKYPNKLKESLILKSKNHPASFEYKINIDDYDYQWQAGNLNFYKKGKQGQDLYKLFTIPQAYMFEEADTNEQGKVMMKIVKDKLVLTPNEEWIETHNYPIIIDPTVEINILNVQSYPVVGGEWSVQFTTQGEENLTISGISDGRYQTEFGQDIEFISLKCGSQILEPQHQGNNYVYERWSCNEIGEFRVKVLKEGEHHLEFTFGKQVAQAYNNASDPWCSGMENWKSRRKITFDNSAQTTDDLINIPVLVKLDSSRINYEYTQNNGEDIRFCDADDTTELNYEIEEWNESGTSYIWVNVPEIEAASSSDHIWIYYENSNATDNQDVDNTWNSNYKGVWHLSDNAASTNVTDSSGNSNHLTASSTTDSYNISGKMSDAFATMGTPHRIPNPNGDLQNDLYPDLALDSNGYPVIAYHDGSEGDLILIHCNDFECKGDNENEQAVATAGDTGEYPSLELDGNGYPMIAYFDNGSDDLNYIHCDDVNCAGTETEVALDTGGTVGQWPSMVLDSSGYPVIAYFDNTNNDVKLIHCDDADCSSYSTEVVDSSANSSINSSISLKLDGSGNPVVAYVDRTAYSLKLTLCNDADCNGGDETTNTIIDLGSNDYRYVSLQLDPSDYPMIAYYDETIDDLFYVHCDDVACADDESGNIVTLTTGAARYPWMELNSSGNPVIVASNGSNPRLFVCADIDCSSDSEDNITLYNQYYGYYPSMVLDSDDKPVIVVYGYGRENEYDVHLYRLGPKIKQNYDADFDFGTTDFSMSLWFKSDDASENYLLSRYDDDQGYKIWLDYGGHPCFGIDDDSSFGADDEICTEPSETTLNMDGQGNDVEENDMELDANGYPVIAFFDETDDDLELVHCNDVNCTDVTQNTVDSTGDVGRTPSLQLDSSGYPVIAYHDNTNNNLKLVHCGDANCSSGNTINTLDSADNVGDYPCLQLDSNGYPVVAYYDTTNTAIKLVHCNDVNCADSDESVETVDNSEYDRTRSLHWMELDSNGYPVMAYYNETDDDLKVTHCNDANCSDGDETITTVETSGRIGEQAALVLDSNDYPVVAVRRRDFDMKLIHCNDVDCAGGDENSNYIDDGLAYMDKGLVYNDIKLNSSGYPVILTFSYALQDNIIITCNDANCAGGDEHYSYIRDDSNEGQFHSFELDSQGYPVVAYANGSNRLNLMHASSPTYTDTNAYDDGSWHYLTAVKDDTDSIKLYIDGSEVASDESIAATGTLTSNSAELRFAETITKIASTDYSTYNWNGSMDEVQIDTTARTDDWVAFSYCNMNDTCVDYSVEEPFSYTVKLKNGTIKLKSGTIKINLKRKDFRIVYYFKPERYFKPEERIDGLELS